MFWMCEHTVRTAASSFLVPNHFSTFNVRGDDMWRSNDKCLKFLFNTPRGPLIVTIRDFTVASMPRGIFTHWFALMVLILPYTESRGTRKKTKQIFSISIRLLFGARSASCKRRMWISDSSIEQLHKTIAKNWIGRNIHPSVIYADELSNEYSTQNKWNLPEKLNWKCKI